MSDLKSWKPCQPPDMPVVEGSHIRIEPARFPGHAEELFAAVGGEGDDALWAYIPIGPFDDAETMAVTLNAVIAQQNWQTHLLRSVETGEVVGMASYMRIRPEHGSVEIGCIMFSRKLQQTPAATEAMYLMARHIFDLGYRRYEWKCNDANAASKRAALRLGFTYEGIFRQDMVMKGANRDTAWYSMLDSEWPDAKAAFEAWLAPENFDRDGRQRNSLSELRQA